MNTRPGLWWAVAATTSLLGAGAWLRWPSSAVLLACVAAAVWSIALTWPRGRRAWHHVGFAIAIAAFVTIAGHAERERSEFTRTADAFRAEVAGRATADMVRAVESEAAALQRIAILALDAPAETGRAFERLDALRGDSPWRAVALARNGKPLAWSGRMVTPLDSLAGPVGIVGTPFYLGLYAIAGRATDRAVAVALLHAERPANTLTSPLDETIARRDGVQGFAYVDPSAAVRDSFAIARVGSVPMLGLRAIAPPGEQLAAGALELGRTRGGLVLALAVFFFLAASWPGGGVAGRLGALAVTLTVESLVPLSSFSNVSVFFNPAYFYVPQGGPFAGSVGALALTCVFGLLALLLLLRSGPSQRSRVRGLVFVVAIAGIGPFLLRDLARGIQFPQSGAPSSLWLAWESTLFLASVTVLLAGVTAGRAALGGWRGLPLWIAPAIAAVAAALAPLLIEAPGAFPPWYPVLWVLAIGALALGRRRRRAIRATAIVAACGAVTLVWGQSVKARVGLAERDVAGLRTTDPAATALLRRFTAQLDPARAPATRVELLARYAASDLANGDYPVELTSWDSTGRPEADLRVGMGPGNTSGVDIFAREAEGGTEPILRSVPGIPGLQLVLSVPHADKSVTTVVVAPRTRLVPRDPFGALIGLGGPPPTDPPYSLRIGDAGPGAPITERCTWVRRVDELHGDCFFPAMGGNVAWVHAQVELRDYEALFTRGALVVLFNLLMFALLRLVLVMADGVLVRWLRLSARRWVRSYRAQLTFALFAFFVAPALAFAVWSYGRLQADDDQARDLLVRETLRGVAASTDSARLPDIAARFETPLFLYANGLLVTASDPLLEELAPIGRLLPADADQALTLADDITSGDEELVGRTPMRFGFRSAIDTSGVRFVLAAPARTDDLALDRRRRDLGILVLFATAVGALAALWLSGLAARQFSRPIGALRRGAMALAAGEREPRLANDPPVEFQPVFSAFRQMARDLEASREQDAHAQRVLAWGEMARQVAHEIKNPLTPIRLGVQHLRRARFDPRVDFDRVLDENVTRVLAEIDRLDEIARAFSRYGTPSAERAGAQPVDVSQIVDDVVRLEQLGGEPIEWCAKGTAQPLLAMASGTELREVLLNLLENARLAEARCVTVTASTGDGAVRIAVTDDGQGIAADVLPRIFEPHFSTRTSGSGLGLAISRRLIEGWGGTIAVESAPGRGTTVRIALVPATPG